MKEHFKNLIRLKLDIDNELHTLRHHLFPIKLAEKASVDPIKFFENLFPFWSTNVMSTSLEFVDSEFVIGGTYRYRNEKNIDFDYLEKINKNAENGYDTPTYYKVDNFPLYIAEEGKNRVEIFRSLKSKIYCRVKVTNFPAPNEIKLHKVVLRKNLVILSFKNSKYVIPYSEVVVPFLIAYGVSFGGKIMNPFYKKSDKSFKRQLTQWLMMK